MKHEVQNDDSHAPTLGMRPLRPEDLRPKPMRDKRAHARACRIIESWGSAIRAEANDSANNRVANR